MRNLKNDEEKTKFEKKITKVILIAGIANRKFEEKELNELQSIRHVIDQATLEGITRDDWFAIDDQLRLRFESASFFWLIRRIRNNPLFWEM
jgi:hypothetical protein